MSSPNPTPSRRAQLRQTLGENGWTRARAVASLGMVFGLGAVGTMAAWSDTATATTGMFETSAVNIRMTLNDVRPTYQFAAIKQINMARGATTAGILTVKNTGSDAFNYVVGTEVANNGTATYGSASAATLAQNLLVTVRKGGTVSGSGQTATCGGGILVGTADKPLALGTTAGFLPTSANVAVNGTEALCVQVKVKADAPKEARMAAVSVRLNFTATKV